MNIKIAYLNISNVYCRIFLKGFIFSLMGFFLGCQTSKGTIIKETPLLLEQTRKVIVSVIGEPRGVTENGRDFYSSYFDKKEVPLLSDEQPLFRYYTFVSIRGDRRPYDIIVDVIKEKKISEKKYELNDHDETLAKRVANKIKQMLNQSRDKRNVIDDFRPF